MTVVRFSYVTLGLCLVTNCIKPRHPEDSDEGSGNFYIS